MTAVTTSSQTSRQDRVPNPPKPPRGLPSVRKILMVGGAYLIALIFITPYLEMLLTALRPVKEDSDPTIIPKHFQWSNFTSVFSGDSSFGTNMRITLEVAFGATFLVLLVALPAAYYTARKRFRGRKAFLFLVLVTQMFQPTAMVVGIYGEMRDLNMINSVWALIIVDAGFNLAFAVWILSAYFSAIPVELEQAAMIDGATRFGAFRRVTIPLAMPGIVTALIFTFIAAWNEFIVALTLTTSPDKAPLSVAVDNYIGQYTVDYGHLFASTVIATIPVIVLFGLIERKVVDGLTAGSIK
ncbi:carbohydrate ABC transporter permease [Catenulispora sp. NF23]|uniref:Carbohydrate ABC transporter permease n=1 Tax=Catenulispora pinistramenti TaxID=2705254 RepID=A0ABS5KMU7_9ACTN|nr:carbohydrate ABC transporter permease [Catenulispora pinistramenti]MBS2531879.1 carbohydrate ABC transporter permease [Catenulispora pinistramenti]MBS2547358.1 carbohydrate ABC transporter permease [Catenulispora pinistramenti]